MKFPAFALQTNVPVLFFCSLSLSIVLLHVPLVLWAQGYAERFGPRVFVGPVEVSGLLREEARELLQARVDTFLTQGILATFQNQTFVVPLNVVGALDPDAGQDFLRFDVDGAMQQAQFERRSPRPLFDAWLLASQVITPIEIELPISLSRDPLEQAIRQQAGMVEQPAIPVRFRGEQVEGRWEVSVLPPHEGTRLEMDTFFRLLEDQAAELKLNPIPLTLVPDPIRWTEADAAPLIPLAEEILNHGPTTLIFSDPPAADRAWPLTPEVLATAFAPAEGLSDQPVLSLSEEAADRLFGEIASTLEHPARDAVFQMEQGRVTAFVPHAEGVRVNREATLLQLSEHWSEGIFLSDIVTEQTPAGQPLSETNALGIQELLGEGVSSYAGSPANRIRNIRNGVQLLNGLLIAPGEVFSLVEALQPFTAENGYLPELVIKGSRIVPELGGGLCQIGTTTFRATMNSGFPILERQNHSIVVRYYNDPQNNNPGTDATIYGPRPDFRFENTTGAHVLLETEMDESATMLRFRFWGTSDGRKGFYSPPEVLRWIAAPVAQRIETLDLAPGVEQCQASHAGADAEFTYTVMHADGTREDRVFTSHYRALPSICLVGVETLSVPLVPPESTSPPEPSATSSPTI